MVKLVDTLVLGTSASRLGGSSPLPGTSDQTYVSFLIAPMTNTQLFSDGGARGNPGPAGCGWTLQKEGTEIACGKKFLGVTTNNVAEYTGLIEGLRHAINTRETNLHCFLDSLLIVEQIRGAYKVKSQKLKPLFMEIQALIRQFDTISFDHIPREQNKRADELANEAMDEQVF